jgi:hypothetical protein
MKTKILLAFAAIAPLFLIGCALTPVDVTTQEGAGKLYAQFELGRVTTQAEAQAAISGLTRLEADLPNIPLGKVSDQELGALNAQLQQAKLLVNTNDPNKIQILNAIASLGNLIAQNASSGGETAGQAIVAADFTNAAIGIGAGINYVEGGWTVTNPSWVPTSK